MIILFVLFKLILLVYTYRAVVYLLKKIKLMHIKYRFLGLIQRIELSKKEEQEIEELMKHYKHNAKESIITRMDLSGILQESRDFKTYKERLTEYLNKNFEKNWIKSKKLTYPLEEWFWLLEFAKSDVGFDYYVLMAHDKETGYIGNYRDVECYVKID